MEQVFRPVVNKFLDLLQDGDWWTTDKMACELDTSKCVVEKLCNSCAGCGFIRCWRGKGIIKMV